MYSLKKIHITPNDYLIKFKEFDEDKESYVKYFIEPMGPFESNEMSDTVYVKDDFVPYHEHSRGIETFLIDHGSVEVGIRGKRTIATRGDIIHLQPFVSHQFRFLEEGTIWRELFQEIQMNAGILEDRRIKEYHKETLEDEGFKEDRRKRDQGYWYKTAPVLEDVPKEKIPEIRDYDFGFSTFQLEGGLFKLKVGRWETHGLKEIWQLLLEPGYQLNWSERNPYWILFIVYKGSVKVTLDGQESFIARERDILHIPNYLAGKIIATENTVLLDYNCQGYMLRAMEELSGIAQSGSDKLNDPAFLKEIILKHDCHIQGNLNK